MKNTPASLLLLLSGLALTSSAQPAPAPGAPAVGSHVIINRVGAGVPAQPPSGPVTYLGVVTARVDPTLTEQLGLPREMGLVVTSVMPDSPAAGVLKPHDVLLKFNDQMLVNIDQLGVLVRSCKDGEEVSLTYVRAGKQASVRVRLAQRQAPRLAEWTATVDEGWGHAAPPSAVTFSSGRVQINRVPGALAGEEVNRTLSLVNPSLTISPGPAPIMRRADIGLSSFVFSDEAGTLELKGAEGKRELVAKDATGAVQFSGPVNTDEERKAMPEEVRSRFEKMEGINTLHFQVGEDFKAGDVRVVTPRVEGVRLQRVPRPLPSLRVL